jgi:hypothetical protein
MSLRTEGETMAANSQKYLPLSSRNFALVNGEHIGSRTENEN